MKRKSVSTEVGTRVSRKRDGKLGTVTARELSIPSVTYPGIYGKTIVTIAFDEGGWDSTGDLPWFRSNFREVK